MSVPPRWQNCPRKSNLIADRFLAFKTFLDSRYDAEVPEENRWQLPMLLGYLARYKKTLGLVIDLTNTSRFYNRNDLDDAGIKYIKINCKGHGEAPNVEQTNNFIRTCSKFWNDEPEKIIGIHCTHGFNRTGFLIISYLVQVLEWSLEAANQVFLQNRSPGIYKQHYLDDLCKRYDESESLQAPELPEWCLEEEEGSDNEAENGGQENDAGADGSRPDGGRKRQRREFKTSEAKFMDGVTGITVAPQPTFGDIQRACQDICGWERSGFPGSQPVSMDVHNIGFLNKKLYRVTWKADGVRYMMYIKGLHEIYLIDRDNAVFEAPQLTFPQRKVPHSHVQDTLLDGELVMDKNDDQLTPRYLIYDIVRFQGQAIGKMSHDVRMRCIDIDIIGPRNNAVKAGTLDKRNEPFSIRSKQFFPVEKSEWILKEFSPKLTHETDGLVFNAVDEEYIPGPCPGLLKWKPHTLNSVDFQLHITTVQQEGCLKEKVGALRVGGYDQAVGFIKITNELKNLDKKIIECTYNGKEWVFMRQREDKSYPNSYATAQSVCQSIKKPVTQEWLLEVVQKHRFRPNHHGGHAHGQHSATTTR
ncbi:mRNA-capping enzyme-like [Dendronephthya gigantea]|uniref:mRNA-capping enzyme-like n=1 Tax=Dendronephthya gigantea TaxID=151771 RepID=UPI00106CECAE|nr:mRNA-capping enzyme-like [Dendronephthya gigantea]